MSDFHVLSLTTFLPLIGAVLILFTRGDDAFVAKSARILALITSTVTFLLSLYIWFNFDRTNPGFQFEEHAEWMPTLKISYRMGVDGISMTFVLLSTLLTPICILASWEAITVRVKEYMVAFLVLETLMVGTFCALDILAFYIFFEGVLIPMYLIIGIWGGPRRVYSALKFFLFTLLGSVLMLLAILAMYGQGRHHRHPHPDADPFRPGHAEMALAGLLRVFRGEDADVAGPHLAARRACGGRRPRAR